MDKTIFNITLILFLSLFSVLLTGAFRQYALRKGLIDRPNHRSSHLEATPRGGGIVFVFLWLVMLVLATSLHWFPLDHTLVFLPGVLMIAAVSYLDDQINLSAKWRFLVQILAASASLYCLGGFWSIDFGITALSLGWFGVIAAILAIVWSTNLFNFMDGTDGIASCEAIFIFGLGGLLLWLAGGKELAILSWTLVAVVAGFLKWNWPPAKIFMGDVGSAVLGFLIIPFAIAGKNWYGIPVILWLMLYGLFLFDTTVTLIRRILAGERWYEAHRSHAYQRLHQSGWSHLQVLWGSILVNSLLGMLVMISYFYRTFIPAATVLAVIILSVAYWFVRHRKPMFMSK